MAKYHIKKDGTPGVCRAKNGNCPLGGNENHFDSMEAAQDAAQERMEQEFGLVDEPYSSRPIIQGKNVSDYDRALMKDLNTDGVLIEKREKPGYTPEYRVHELIDNQTITFKPYDEKTDSVDDYLTNRKHVQKFKVDVDGASYIMNASQLNNKLSEMKDKKRLEEVTHRAVAQFNRMDYNSKEAQALQKRIRENEIAGDFVANKALEKKATSRKVSDRTMAAESGYAQETLVNDKNEFVRAAVASNGDPALLEKLKNDKEPIVRATVADQGYALEELSTDEDPQVRGAVARQGYASEILKNDSNPRVREQVALSGKELTMLSNDKDPRVRLAVARTVAPGKFGKDYFVNDENKEIRKYLARNGHGLDILKNDSDPEVAKLAREYK